MRDELATLYKTQSQNAQRLLVLNEQMRDRDEKERETGDESRRVTEELVRLRRKEEDLRGVVSEKDKMIQVSLANVFGIDNANVHFKRFYKTSSLLFHSNSIRLNCATMTSRETMPAFCNAGWTV